MTHISLILKSVKVTHCGRKKCLSIGITSNQGNEFYRFNINYTLGGFFSSADILYVNHMMIH